MITAYLWDVPAIAKTFEAFSTAIKEWITQEKLSRANLLRLLVDCSHSAQRRSMFKKSTVIFGIM